MKGTMIAVCFVDSSIMIWSLKTFELKYKLVLPPHEEPPGLTSFCVSDENNLVVAGGHSSSLYVWELQSQTLIRIVDLPNTVKKVIQVDFISRGSTIVLVLGDDGRLNCINITAKIPKVLMQLAPQNKAIINFSIDSHGKYLGCGTSDGSMLLFDMDIARNTSLRIRKTRDHMGIPVDDDDPIKKVSLRSSFSDTKFPRNNSEDAQLETASLPDTEKIVAMNPKSHTDIDQVIPPSSSKSVNVLDTVFGNKRKTPKQSVVFAEIDPDEEPEVEQKNASQSKYREKKENQNLRSPSLYELTKSGSMDFRLTHKRLQSLLRQYGEFPAKYRLIVWRCLLRLPENQHSYLQLKQKGTHSSFKNLYKTYPIQNQRLFRHMVNILSCIAHWGPVFGEVSYLPASMFPFLKVFEYDELCAFETCLCILVHWCKDWLQMFPHPPLYVLGHIEQYFKDVDAQLHDHFVRYEITVESYAWSLLKSLFTEVFTREEWLQLWDHIFVCAKSYKTMLHGVLFAYLSYYRLSLLSIHDKIQLEQFFHQQHTVDMVDLIRSVYLLQKKPSYRSFENRLLHAKDKMNQENSLSASNYSNIDDKDVIERSNYSMWPLPKDYYPTFQHYPKFVVDYQIQERQKISLHETEVIQKQQMVKELEEKIDQLQFEYELNSKQQESILKAEEERRTQSIQAEKKRLEELKSVESEARKARLLQISKMELATRDALQKSTALREAELKRMETEASIKKQREEYEIERRREEEKLQQLEFQAVQRMKSIQKQQEAEQRVRRVYLEKKQLETKLEYDAKEKAEKEKLENEERKLRQRLEIEEQERVNALNEEIIMQHEMEIELLKKKLDQQSNQLISEKERHLRHLEEDEAARIEKDTKLRQKEEQLLIAEQKKEAQKAIEDFVSEENKFTEKRKRILDEERRKQALESASREMRIQELKRRENTWKLHESMVQNRERLSKKNQEEEEKYKEVLLQMDQERRNQAEFEFELTCRQDLLREELETRQELRNMSEEEFQRRQEILDKERKKLDNDFEKEVQQRLNDHEDSLARVTVSREQLKLKNDKNSKLEEKKSSTPIKDEKSIGKSDEDILKHAKDTVKRYGGFSSESSTKSEKYEKDKEIEENLKDSKTDSSISTSLHFLPDDSKRTKIMKLLDEEQSASVSNISTPSLSHHEPMDSISHEKTLNSSNISVLSELQLEQRPLPGSFFEDSESDASGEDIEDTNEDVPLDLSHYIEDHSLFEGEISSSNESEEMKLNDISSPILMQNLIDENDETEPLSSDPVYRQARDIIRQHKGLIKKTS